MPLAGSFSRTSFLSHIDDGKDGSGESIKVIGLLGKAMDSRIEHGLNTFVLLEPTGQVNLQKVSCHLCHGDVMIVITTSGIVVP